MTIVISKHRNYVNRHRIGARARMEQELVSETRKKMIAGAIDLVRRRGVNATSIRDVVQHSGTPRGSVAHHFPRGKQQLIEEAVMAAGREVGEPLKRLLADRGTIAGLRAFVASWRRVLETSDFAAGCPVLAAAIEEYVEDGQGGDDKKVAQQAKLHTLVDQVFDDWQSDIAASLRREGVPLARARRLAVLVVSSIEGTVALCRAARSAKSLDDVWIELEALLTEVVG
jgi:AcrR family transcriptional regulator